MAKQLLINGMKARPGEGIFEHNDTKQMRKLYYIECQFEGKWLPLSEGGYPKLFLTPEERNRAMFSMARKYQINPTGITIKPK